MSNVHGNISLNMDGIRNCIYMLISPSKKVYVGQTNNIKRRFREHKRAGGGCRAIHNAIGKYGWENFRVTIEAECAQEHLNELEIAMIAKFNG